MMAKPVSRNWTPLQKPDATAKRQPEQTIEQAVHDQGDKNDKRKFDRDVGSHLPTVPQSDREPIRPATQRDERHAVRH